MHPQFPWELFNQSISPGFCSQLLPIVPFPLTQLLRCYCFHLFPFHFAFRVPSAAIKRNKTDKSQPLHSDAEWESTKRSQIQAVKLLFGQAEDRCVGIFVGK